MLKCSVLRFCYVYSFSDNVKKQTNYIYIGFPGDSDGKESICNAGDLGLRPGWEDPQEEGMATHSSTLAWRIPMDRKKPGGLHGVAKSRA